MTLHSAPPVTFPVGRSRFPTQLLLGLWTAGLLLTSVWGYTLGPMAVGNWRSLAGFLAVAAAGFAAVHAWRHRPTGLLAWDGLVWRWESGGYQTGISEYSLLVLADLQSRLVLRLENQAGAPLCLWLERSAFPDRWLDLRRAVYSPHRSTHTAQAATWLAVEPAAAYQPPAPLQSPSPNTLQP